MAAPVEPSDTGQGPAAVQPHGSPQSARNKVVPVWAVQTCDSRTLGVNFQLGGLPATNSLETPYGCATPSSDPRGQESHLAFLF